MMARRPVNTCLVLYFMAAGRRHLGRICGRHVARPEYGPKSYIGIRRPYSLAQRASIVSSAEPAAFAMSGVVQSY
jgi:hypothetical protein